MLLKPKPIFIFKTFFAVICFCIFIKMFLEDLNKFQSKITTTGTRTRNHPNKTKAFPCITLCPLSGFRKREFHFTSKTYKQNTFELADIFDNETCTEVQSNKSAYSFKELRTYYFGRCYTICSLVEMEARRRIMFNLKPNLILKLYFHNLHDEFWLIGSVTYEVDMFETIIETNRTDGIKAVVLLLAETESTYLNKKNDPCHEASNELDPKESLIRFQQCCKDNIWDRVSQRINCTVPGYEEIVGKSFALPECKDSQTAAHSLNQLYKSTSEAATMALEG